jgi:hypothetical protein
MGWIVGPVVQEPGVWLTWHLHHFNKEPGGVVVTAEALGDGTTVISTNSGSHQPNFAEAQQAGNPYKTYRLNVGTGTTFASFWLRGIG